MIITSDFNDIKIIELDSYSKETKINIDMFIGRKIDEKCLAIFLHFNEFLVNEYIFFKYNIIPKIKYNWQIKNINSFLKIRIQIVFPNSKENRHSQILRDTLYRLILGVNDDSFFKDKNFLLNFSEMLKKLNSKNYFDDMRLKIENIILKYPSISELESNNILYNILTNPKTNSQILIKLYLKGTFQVSNYMFKKNMYVNTPYQNYIGFFDNLFNKLPAGYMYSLIDHNNIKVRNFERLTTLNYNMFILTVKSNNNLIRQKFVYYMLKVCLNLLTKNIMPGEESELIYIEDSTIIWPNRTKNYIMDNFIDYWRVFLNKNFNALKIKFWQELQFLVSKKNYLELLFLCDYSKIKFISVDDAIIQIQEKIHLFDQTILINDVLYKMCYNNNDYEKERRYNAKSS